MAEPDERGEPDRPASPRRRRLVLKPKVNYSEFKVHVVTWNVASAVPTSSDVESLFLPQSSLELRDIHNDTDMIAVGLQEAYQSIADTVGSVVGRDPTVEEFSSYLATKGFARLAYSRMLGVVIIVYVKRPLLCYITEVQTCTTKTGLAGFLGNKGATSVRFTLAGLGVCFTNCHLVPHVENMDRRREELKEIFASQLFESSRLPSSTLLDHDIVILFGDLNFRLEGGEFHQVLCDLEEGRLKQLLDRDQLMREQIRGTNGASRLHQFMEMTIDFRPSYKYQPGSDTFADGGKGRAPAWCDRILWRIHDRTLPDITESNPRPLISQQYYGLHMQPRISDHKAVSAGLQLSLDLSHFVPKVVFHLEDWVSGQHGTIAFDVTPNTDISYWDWIGLYPSNFSCVDRDYEYWIYSPAARGVSDKERYYKRELSPENVPTAPGAYVLLYKSVRYGSVIGMSPVFRINALD